LLDLRCSGSDAPIVTPYRSTSQRHCQKRADHDARSPARAGSFSGGEPTFAEAAVNGEVAPIPDARGDGVEPPESTLSGLS
jgi:hypothetical protein